MQRTPYNTGKVEIGKYYVPRRQPMDMSRDMERLQSALLEMRNASRSSIPKIGSVVKAVIRRLSVG